MVTRKQDNKDAIEVAPPSSNSASGLKSKRSRIEMPRSGNWLMTFTDMMALMLTFFVMTYSMANPKQEIWDDVKTQVNMEFSKTLGEIAQRGEVNDISFERVKFDEALSLSYLEALFINQLEKRNLQDKVFIIPQPNSKRLILTIPSDLLFDSGQSRLSNKSGRMLKQLTEVLKGIQNSIEIVGHADPKPVKNAEGQYRSNWDLSLERSMSIAQKVRSYGYKHPLHLRGLSSSLYDNLPQDLSYDERLRMSRRVDFIIYDQSENFSERLGVK